MSEKETIILPEGNFKYIDRKTLEVEIPTDITEPVSKIVIDFNNSFLSDIICFTCKHAVNQVISDFILDKKVTNLSITNSYTYDFRTPQSMSNLLIELQTNQSIKELIKSIRIYTPIIKDEIIKDNGDHNDYDSISFRKRVQIDSNDENGYLITDGSLKTTWKGHNYPTNIDIDLDAIYELSKIILYFPKKQNVIFDIYGSENGLDYSFISHHNVEIDDDRGYEVLISNFDNVAFVRVNVLYNSGSDDVLVKQIRVFGNYLKPMKKIFSFDFLQNKDIKTNSISMEEALRGIVERRVGYQYVDWFQFKIIKSNDNYFKLENFNNRILISGSSGVSIATGLNYYLKYYCNVNITQDGMGDQIRMPDRMVSLNKTIKRTSSAKYIYSYNYTTFSYTMAFWDEKRWQKELDWLALNGVNLMLDPIGQETVWAVFLRELGYSDTEIQRQVSFSTFSAWQWMGNVSGVG